MRPFFLVFRKRKMQPCKIWNGAKNGQGYGVTGDKLIHRLTYCWHHKIPLETIDGLFIRHSCDTPSCYEITHLEVGTHADNMRDMRIRKRSNKGEKNGMAVLTFEQVEELKRDYIPWSKTKGRAAMATKYGISPNHVSRIIKGRRWNFESTESFSWT